MQTIQIPEIVQLLRHRTCDFVVKGIPRCQRQAVRGHSYCAMHLDLLKKQKAEIQALAEQAKFSAPHFPKRKLCQIYFVGTKPGEPVKIGKTVSLKHRLTGIQTGSPYKLTALAWVVAPPKLEERLHEELAEHRLEGEWFAWCPEIEILIDCAKQGRIEPIAHFVGWQLPY